MAHHITRDSPKNSAEVLYPITLSYKQPSNVDI